MSRINWHIISKPIEKDDGSINDLYNVLWKNPYGRIAQFCKYVEGQMEGDKILRTYHFVVKMVVKERRSYFDEILKLPCCHEIKSLTGKIRDLRETYASTKQNNEFMLYDLQHEDSDLKSLQNFTLQTIMLGKDPNSDFYSLFGKAVKDEDPLLFLHLMDNYPRYKKVHDLKQLILSSSQDRNTRKLDKLCYSVTNYF